MLYVLTTSHFSKHQNVSLITWKSWDEISFGETHLIPKVAWFHGRKCVLHLIVGGLGIGNIHAANMAILSKWWWRFHNENNALWKQIITSIHGINGGIFIYSLPNHKLFHSPWVSITKINSSLSNMDVNLHSLFNRVIGDGSTMSFWNDLWIRDSTLSSLFRRIFSLKTSMECTINDQCNNNNVPKSWMWEWWKPIRGPRRMPTC